MPTRRRRKRIGTSTATAVTAQAPNRVWAVDFQFDATDDGRPIKIVSIIPRWATRFRPDSLPSASTDNRLSRSVDRSTGSRQLDEIEASSEVDRRNGNIYSWEFQELLGPSIPTTCAARMHAELDAIRECGRHQRGTATGPQPVDVRQLLYSIVDVELSETLRGLVVPYKRATYDSVSGAWLSGRSASHPGTGIRRTFLGRCLGMGCHAERAGHSSGTRRLSPRSRCDSLLDARTSWLIVMTTVPDFGGCGKGVGAATEIHLGEAAADPQRKIHNAAYRTCSAQQSQ